MKNLPSIWMIYLMAIGFGLLDFNWAYMGGIATVDLAKIIQGYIDKKNAPPVASGIHTIEPGEFFHIPMQRHGMKTFIDATDEEINEWIVSNKVMIKDIKNDFYTRYCEPPNSKFIDVESKVTTITWSKEVNI